MSKDLTVKNIEYFDSIASWLGCCNGYCVIYSYDVGWLYMRVSMYVDMVAQDGFDAGEMYTDIADYCNRHNVEPIED